MKVIKTWESFIRNDFIIQYDKDRIVYHTTGKEAANDIMRNGFKTGFDLGVAEKRKAIYFSDIDVNYGLYARNKEGETYEGQEVGHVAVNIKGLKLLNMSYKENGEYVNYKKYKNYNVRGEIDKIPYDIDGTISYLEDDKIYEVALKLEVANSLIEK